MKLYTLQSFVTGFFHAALYLWDSSMWWPVIVADSLSMLYGFLFWKYCHWWLFGFWFLAVANVLLWILVRVSLWIYGHISVEYTTTRRGVELLAHRAYLCSLLIDTMESFSKTIVTNLQSHPPCMDVMVAWHSCQHRVLSVFFIQPFWRYASIFVSHCSFKWFP